MLTVPEANVARALEIPMCLASMCCGPGLDMNCAQVLTACAMFGCVQQATYMRESMVVDRYASASGWVYPDSHPY